jgi:hypothetical protein
MQRGLAASCTCSINAAPHCYRLKTQNNATKATRWCMPVLSRMTGTPGLAANKAELTATDAGSEHHWTSHAVQVPEQPALWTTNYCTHASIHSQRTDHGLRKPSITQGDAARNSASGNGTMQQNTSRRKGSSAHNCSHITRSACHGMSCQHPHQLSNVAVEVACSTCASAVHALTSQTAFTTNSQRHAEHCGLNKAGHQLPIQRHAV